MLYTNRPLGLLERECVTRGHIPKLQISCTGAWAEISMRFRSKAARCIGKIKGPNESSNEVKLQAG